MTYSITEWSPSIVSIDGGVKPPVGKIKRGVWLSFETNSGTIQLNLDLEQAAAIRRMLKSASVRCRGIDSRAKKP